jgi:hypothetical protein
MPIIVDPPVSPPLPPPPDVGTSLAELLYSGLPESFTRRDASGHLRLLCEGLMAPLETTWDLVRPRTDRAGWDIALDPDECPAAALPWLAQWVGVEVTPEMSEQQLRDEIREPTGWKRGQDESIRVALRRTLVPLEGDGEPLVIIRPNTPEVGRHYVRTLLAETPEPDRTEEVLRSRLPWWTRLDNEAITGVTYADLEASKYQTYAELEASPITTYRALEEALPGDL